LDAPAQVDPRVLGHAPNILLIPGTSNLEHLAENIATTDVHLDADTMTALDKASSPST
jgi:aryl-alcohol dehydrogenase-like predicted oxidoreductase